MTLAPADRIGDPLPSAFPEGLLAEDPLLAGVEDNPVYDAFRRRREMHRRSWFQFRNGAAPGADLRGRPSFGERTRIGVGGLCWVLLSLGTAWPAVTLASGHINRRGHSLGTRLPGTANEVCSIFGGHRTTLTDLYMSGCTGGDIVRAIYGEYLESVGIFRRILMGVLIGGMLLLGTGGYFGALVPAHLFAAAVGIACVIAIHRRVPVELMRLAVLHHVEPIVIHWGAESVLEATKRHQSCVFWRQFRTIVALLVCAVALAVFLVAMAPWLQRVLFNGTMWFGIPPVFWPVFGAVLLSTGIWGANGNAARREWTPIAEGYFAEADRAFEHYMRDVVLEE